jgi:2,4-dienoyl-CoA reductase-like NADH-dependent reductase (Old Yellow Enzyme family)
MLPLHSSDWPNAPGLWNEDQVAGWKNVTDAVHAVGGHIYAQVSRISRA